VRIFNLTGSRVVYMGHRIQPHSYVDVSAFSFKSDRDKKLESAGMLAFGKAPSEYETPRQQTRRERDRKRLKAAAVVVPTPPPLPVKVDPPKHIVVELVEEPKVEDTVEVVEVVKEEPEPVKPRMKSKK